MRILWEGLESQSSVIHITTEFIDMLNTMRIGKVTEDHIAKWRELDRPVSCPNGIEPVQLYASLHDFQGSLAQHQ